MKRSVVILVLLSIALNFACGAIYSLFNHNCALFDCDEVKATNYYMAIDRISVMLFALAFYLFSKEHRVLNNILFAVFAISMSEVLDELFFDPTKLQLNELIIALITLFYLIKLWYKTTQKT